MRNQIPFTILNSDSDTDSSADDLFGQIDETGFNANDGK